jgi:hypothetical protein
MNLQLAKMELIEMLLNTNRVEVLKKIKELLDENQERLTEEDYLIIDQRREKHLKKESKSYTWEEVKSNLRK